VDSEVVEVLNEIRNEVKGINGRLDKVDGRLDTIDGRLDKIDGRLDQIDGRLSHLDARMDVTNMRVDSLEQRVNLGFEKNDVRFLLLEATLRAVEQAVTKGFLRVWETMREFRKEVLALTTDHEHRIVALEKKTS